MKKLLFIICSIAFIGCSKNEVIYSVPCLNNEVISHLTQDDLVLIDGQIQLSISKDEAISRGIPASEFDLAKETLIRHNERTTVLLKKQGKGKTLTQSERYGNTLAFGMLQDPPVYYFNYVNSIPLCVANEESAGGIILSYTFSSESITDLDRHVLKYSFYGPCGGMGEIEEYGYSIGDYPFPGFTFGSLSLEYNFYGSSSGICVYQIYDNT